MEDATSETQDSDSDLANDMQRGARDSDLANDMQRARVASPSSPDGKDASRGVFAPQNPTDALLKHPHFRMVKDMVHSDMKPVEVKRAGRQCIHCRHDFKAKENALRGAQCPDEHVWHGACVMAHLCNMMDAWCMPSAEDRDKKLPTWRIAHLCPLCKKPLIDLEAPNSSAASSSSSSSNAVETYDDLLDEILA